MSSGGRRQRVAVLGVTGSIGGSTLDVIDRHPDRFELVAVSAGSRAEALLEVLVRHQPRRAALADPAGLDPLAQGLRARGLACDLASGPAALVDLACDPEVDVVVAAIVGAAGLEAVMAAAAAGKRVLLANKEALVVGGALLVETARKAGAALLPVDSEHNALLQCLPQGPGMTPPLCAPATVRRLWLTASGGPLWQWPQQALAKVTVAQALAHPNWRMGAKISIDSATMMNKGLEVIEAHWLFGLPAEAISVVVHPQSTVHSLVEYVDGSLLAQLGAADMRTPIAVALAWPERIASGVGAPDPTAFGSLDFAAPDPARFPCLDLAYQALRAGGSAPVVLNAANEVAVTAFLKGRLPFTGIAEAVNQALQSIPLWSPGSLAALLATDALARRQVETWLSARA